MTEHHLFRKMILKSAYSDINRQYHSFHGGNKGEANLIKEWGLAIWYPNQLDVKKIPNTTAGEENLLAYALEKFSKLAVDKKRNGVGCSNSVNRHISKVQLRTEPMPNV